eukprot:TRINITY_DN5518_c0_g1_i2.p1 TRINITY_DN5518_c0_g1~~TRINITY_DN5518_c0_g1_i2.p1  ORF type:complete len:1069 (+),score=410.93 TRINITY_DN5518_c0_g1_i2:98-3304(+)
MGGFGSSARERVKVHVRLRPHNANDERRNEHGTGEGIQVNPDGEIQVTKGVGDVKKFRFDSFLGPTATQQDVFVSAAQSIIEDVIAGYNGCIMCYGQTGTGKTYTLGNDVTEGMVMSEQTIGITGRALRTIFETARNDHSCDYQVSMSYVQIYMEMIQDLLEIKNDQVQVREDPERGVFLQGAAVYRADSEQQCREIIEHGNRNRATAFTEMNASSSRSHAVLCVMVQRRTNPTVREVQLRDGVTSTEQDMVGVKATAGKLYCVDLAGSERAKKSGAKGTRMEELKSINASLSALGNCISALADASAGKSAHIPFRDSRLTRLLQDSLGGNAKTSLVITVGPSAEHVGETLNSLSFGQRAMRVVMHAKVNQEIDYKTMCIQLQAELDTKDDIIHHLENRLKLAEERAMGRQTDSPIGMQSASMGIGSSHQPLEIEQKGMSRASMQADVEAAAQAMEDEVSRVMTIWKGKLDNQQLQCDQRYASMEGMLTKEVENLRSELGKANSRVASSKTVMDRNRSELEAAQQELNKLEKEHFERLRDLLSKQEELKGKANEKTQTIETLNAEVMSLKATLDTKMAEVTGSLASSSRAQSELEAKMKEAKAEVTRLQDMLHQANKQSTQRESTNKTLQDQIADLKSQMSRQVAEKASAASKAEQLEQEKEKAKDMAHQQIKDVQSQAAAAERALAELKLQITHKDGELEKLRSAKEKAESEQVDVAKQLAACKLLEDQSGQLAKSRSGEITKLDETVKELKRKLDIQIDECNVAKDKLDKELAKSAEKASEQGEKTKEIEKLQADFLEAHTKAEKFEGLCQQLNEEKAQVEATAKDLESKEQATAADKAKLDSELRESQDQIAAKNAEVAQLTSRTAQIESQNQISVEALKAELDLKAKELAQKTQDLIDASEEQMLLKSSTELELEQAHEEAASSQVQVLSLQQKIEGLTANVSSMRDSESTTSDQMHTLEASLKQKCQELEALEQKHQGTVAETGQQVGELESKISELEAELAAKKSALQSQETANTEAGSALSEAQATIELKCQELAALEQKHQSTVAAVSYTHLTLPTKRIV